MIKVNLSGSQKKAAAAKAVAVSSRPDRRTHCRLLHLVLLLGAAAGGYFWYSQPDLAICRT